jgi:PhzF family phenazine biosynthesis protein
MTIYQVDAFTNKLFGGNPAAVCPLEDWLDDDVMQLLAAENNLSETAFFVPTGDGEFYIRWFTPEYEIDLCGHATLASAFIIFHELGYTGDTINFQCKSGLLEVSHKGGLIELNFPSRPPQPVAEIPGELLQGLSSAPTEVLKSRDYFLVYENEEDIRNIVPDFVYLNQLNVVGVIVTAPGDDVDFVSRFFVPNSVIGEDPVTGSAHCNLIPYWSKRLDKTVLTAKQISAREGALYCEDLGERVSMAGEAVLYLKGEYFL